MSTYRDTIVIGDGTGWARPPWSAIAVAHIDEMLNRGIEPAYLEVPPDGHHMYRKFYGVPVRVAVGEERVRLVIDVCAPDGTVG